MTRDGNFKKVVRRHAEETGQRYTQALNDLEGLTERMHHEPAAEALLAHVREQYGIDAVAATKLSVHNTYVFRIDRADGEPWVARSFPPTRPRAGVDGDAEILRFLQRAGYPAERVAVDDPVSDLNGSAVLVTTFVAGDELPHGSDKLRVLADLLGRLHALPIDDAVRRPGGASGEDPTREGSPRQDLMAALSLLDSIDMKVAPEHRGRFERLREQVLDADDASGLPEALVHGNLIHAPDHAILTNEGAVAINFKSAGRGPRLSDLAFMLRCCWLDDASIEAVVRGYREHVELTDEELDRLEGVMYIRALYLVCFDYWRAVITGYQPNGTEGWWSFIDPDEIQATAAATRAALSK